VTALAAALLAAGVLGALACRRDFVRAAVPLAAAAVAVGSGAIDLDHAGHAARPLVEPLLFVVLAVLLAEVLGGAGVFRAMASCLPRRRRDPALWALAAATVVVLNLDAAVVLLTPLYIQVARESDEPPLGLAAQPALVACLASSAPPVSNLTNLIAIETGRADLGTFLRLLLLPTVAATIVGYAGWRWRFGHAEPRSDPGPRQPVDRAALRLGLVVLVVLVVGFVPLAALGVPHWVVAGVVLLAVCGHRRAAPPMRSTPVVVLGVAVGLAVCAAALATRADVTGLLGDGTGALGELRIIGVGALGANLVDNLPAFLVGIHAVGAGRPVAALLLGVNVGPTVLVTGTLSGLLWLDVARRAGVRATARTYASFGVAALPALVAAALTFVAVR
jgi:arsenical pump membrane protein